MNVNQGGKMEKSDRLNISFYPKSKRFFDFIFAVPAFLGLLPLGLAISILIMLDDPKGGAPIFLQYRLGKNMKKFKCIKFRTMKREAPNNLATNQFIDAEFYITRLGALLRKTSFDELPQLWNVIKGDMSMVGPRPLILSETHVHEKRQQQGIYAIRPGLTGLAQINGRDLVDDHAKVDYDYKYLQNISMRQDFMIVLRTLHRIILMADISEGASATIIEDSHVPTTGKK